MFAVESCFFEHKYPARIRVKIMMTQRLNINTRIIPTHFQANAN